jgi:signal transduction histidine kinase
MPVGRVATNIMKRSYSTWVFVFGLALLLVLLGALQYRWQSQISESQREKMQKMLNEESARFAEDFDREIQGAYFNFHVGVGDWKAANYHPFVERYEFWKNKTRYPDLIANFYFFDAAGQNRPLKFDKQLATFGSVEWTDELREIFARCVDGEKFSPVLPESYTMIVPEHDLPPEVSHVRVRSSEPSEAGLPRIARSMVMPKAYGFLAIRLDPVVVREKLLPDLSSKHFSDGEYILNISDKSVGTVFQTGDVANPDFRTGMFELSPNDVIFFANKDLERSMGERHEGVLMNTHVESRLSRTEVNRDGNSAVTVEIKRDEGPQTKIFTTKLNGASENWTLSAQHRDGSINAFIANTQIKNLAIGWGMLALLGLAVGAIVFSTQRVRNYAQRQVDFVSSVSHEFRTPLAVIYSAGENLADGVTNDLTQTSRYGELIKGEGRKLSAMVEQILEFAGANSGRQKYNFTEVSVADVVDKAVQDCRPLIDEQKITLETNIDRGLPVINGDADSLCRAMQNLIANSVKYRNGKGWIKVSATNGGGTINISVEDRGIGISQNELRQVFEPFYRSKQVVDAQIHGNGLGLSLVKRIAEAHGGRVNAESELQKGSKFTIELPI